MFLDKYDKSLLTILREATNRENVYLEKFMKEYNYSNLMGSIDEKHLEEFIIGNGLAIKVAGIEPLSVVDGEGLRYTIFTQGCNHYCEGCHNPQTHDFNKGIFVGIEDLYKEICKEGKYIRGITLSGGDPLYSKNYNGVYNLCKRIKTSYENDYDIWLYTGSSWEDINQSEIVKYLDVIVDGEFIKKFKSLNLKFRGSSNQRLINVKESLSRNEVIEWQHI